MSNGNILAVVGGQYGSEGKGVIVNHIADDFGIHVRVGGPNAGHSFWHADRVWKMQVVPCGWTNPDALLLLGRGMLLDLRQLVTEMEDIATVDPTIFERVKIDARAGILTAEHMAEEGGVQGELHRRIGSTGHGVGAARHARMRRDESQFFLAAEGVRRWPDSRQRMWLRAMLVDNTPGIISAARENGANILLEGTQGSGLSLLHGPWPYVTSADTNAAQLAADIGIPPRLVNRTLLVVRTFPIRVAGASGPLYRELTWDEMSRRVGRPVIEQTTVTKKTRRIGEWDDGLVEQAVLLNAPTSMALTFADYLAPQDTGCTLWQNLTGTTRAFVEHLEQRFRVRVSFVGTGGPTWSVVDASPVGGMP
jgi:adenylosuccinate synthase